MTLLYHINGYFKKPLPESSIDTIISNVEKKQMPSRYRNQDIVSKLGIKQSEVEKLRIGHTQKEISERAKRQEVKKRRNEDIELLYAMDYTIEEIAAEHPEISKRTIQRHVAKFRKQTQTEHEKNLTTAEVTRLYRENYSPTGIARRTGITVEEVRRILNLDSMTNLTIQETERQFSESPQFKAAECQELFIVPFTRKKQHTQRLMNTLLPWQRNRIFTIEIPRFRRRYYSTNLGGLQCLPLWGRWRAEGVTEEVDLSHRKRSPLLKGEGFVPSARVTPLK